MTSYKDGIHITNEIQIYLNYHMMLSHCEFFPNEAAVRLLCPKTKVFIGSVIQILQSVFSIGP